MKIYPSTASTTISLNSPLITFMTASKDKIIFVLFNTVFFMIYPGGQLSQSSTHGIPIASILSAGVSVYLDQSDRGSRLRGMRIAREFSVLLGHIIVFDELEAEEERQQQLQLQQFKPNNFCSSSSGDLRGGPRANLISPTGFENDDDSSDSEIEGYECPDENPEDFVPQSNYLRVCLELLLAPDTDKDAHDKQLGALQSIPRIVAMNPIDACDVCGPLIKELLRLNNNFNTDNFDNLRDIAVQALLVRYPNIAAPILCWALNEDIFSISVRVFAISSLARAAFALSGTSRSNEVSAKICNLEKSQEGSDLNQPIIQKNDLKRGTSTIIKRPLKLAASRKQKVILVNSFNAVAPLFFYPILKLLIERISNDSNNIMKERELKQCKGNGDLVQLIPRDSVMEKLGSSFSQNSIAAHIISRNDDNNVKLTDKNKKGLSGSYEMNEGDGLHSMIPVESLLSLAAFVKCSTNSIYQRYLRTYRFLVT